MSSHPGDSYAMIRCSILGPVSVYGADGQALDNAVFQPRRLALLVYLAMQAPRGFTRRDAILPLFWPELDQERARGALRQALYVLRSALGEGVILSRGLDEIALDPASLVCDAVEFERACDAKQWATALELYRGDFLESFYITDAPEFERWMQEQQGRLRLRAATAARALARAQEDAGALIDAVASARRALALNGADEESVRCLLSLLDRQGDRAAAVREYDAFVTRLNAEYGVSPSAETKALLARIRQREDVRHAPVHDTRAPINRTATPSHAPVHASAPTAPGRARRVRLWIASAVVGLTALALSLRPAARGDLTERVVILPFDVRGDAGHGYIQDAVIDLLSTGLDGVGGIQTIDPNAMRALAAASDQPTAAVGRSIARRLGARYFVLGRAVVAGARVRIHSTLYDEQADDDTPLASATREGETAKLFEIVDGISADLIVGSWKIADGRMSRSAALTTRSLPAFKSYLEGERAFQTGDLARSVEALRHAVALDSTFALASYRLSVVVDARNGAWTEFKESAERALRHAHRLSERDRLLLDAHMATVVEDVDDAERRYRALLQRYPDEIEGWYRLAEVIFHQNATTARPLTDAREPFEQLLRLDPANRNALQHLARIAAVQRRTAELDTLYRRILALGVTQAEEGEMRALRVFTGGSRAERERFLHDVANAPPGTFGLAGWVTAIFAGDLEATTRMMRLSTRSSLPSARRAGMRTVIARLHVVHGQIDSATALLREVARLDSTLALEEGAFLAILPFRSVPASALREWRARVGAWQPRRADASTMTNNDIRGPWRPHLRLYLLGHIDALLGDTVEARTIADSLGLMDVPDLPDAAIFARELAVSVRAHVLWRQGKTQDALRALERSPRARPFPYRGSPTRTQDRYVRAELLVATGDSAEALRWYGTFEHTAVPQLVFASPAHLRRAQLYEQLGDRERAAEHYRRFLALWPAPDEEFQPMTALAAERLRRLPAPSS